MLKKLRTAKVTTPVLILSGIGELDTKVRALGFGEGHSQSVIRTGKLALNLDARTLEVDGVRLHLTAEEYAMLKLL